jgi:aldose 1-epimerase
MFQIEEKPFGKYSQYYLKNISSGEYVSVVPSSGATINQVALAKENKVYELLDDCKTYEEFITEGKSKFKGSKLFPFPNRITDGQYSFEKKVYNFPINFPHEKNSIHGILLDSDFQIVEQLTSDSEASLTIRYNTKGNEEGYPFKVVININYQLTEKGFSCTTTLENADEQNIPVGDGWHPYFKTGSKIDNCFLSMPVEYSYEVDRRMIPTGKVAEELTFVKSTRIADTQFDTAYKLLQSEDNFLTTVLVDPDQDLILKIWQETGNNKYNYLQIYIPPDRQSIAIEPMTCLIDAFNNKEGLIILKPCEKRSFSFGLMLE